MGKEQEQESESELETGDVFTFEVGEEAALLEQSSGEDTGTISGTPSRNSVKVSLSDHNSSLNSTSRCYDDFPCAVLTG